jgi:hypothetical protein
MDAITGSLSHSIATMYHWVLVISALAVIAILFIGNARLIIHGKAPHGKSAEAVAGAESR